jgi:hypothetical protein
VHLEGIGICVDAHQMRISAHHNTQVRVGPSMSSMSMDWQWTFATRVGGNHDGVSSARWLPWRARVWGGAAASGSPPWGGAMGRWEAAMGNHAHLLGDCWEISAMDSPEVSKT